MKLVETGQDIPENISIPKKWSSGDKFFTIQNDKQKRGIILYVTINNPRIPLFKNMSSGIFQGQWDLSLFRLFG